MPSKRRKGGIKVKHATSEEAEKTKTKRFFKNSLKILPFTHA